MSVLPDSVRGYFDQVFWPRKSLKNSARTEKLYLLSIARFSEFLGHIPTLSDLTDDSLIAFLAWRKNDCGSLHTVAKDRSCLLSIANAAAKKRHIAEFLDVPTVDPPEASPEAWTQEELDRLFAACRNTCGMIGRALARDWWQAYHYVALFTGERTEAMHLAEWPMLDPASRWLRLPATIRKGRKKPASYLLPEMVVEYVMRLHGRTDRFIFDMPYKRPKGCGIPCMFYYLYKRLLARADLPTGRSCKPQKMRRSFASWLEKAGGNATEALGHEARRTTKRSYLDPRIVGGVAPSAQISGILRV